MQPVPGLGKSLTRKPSANVRLAGASDWNKTEKLINSIQTETLKSLRNAPAQG